MLSYDVLDIGDIFVNSTHQYELSITNKGDIPAQWKLTEPSTPFGNRFSFTPKAGTLAVGAEEKMGVTFCSDILGEFCETFNIGLREATTSCRARSKATHRPTFAFDVDVIDFGLVSYAFLHQKTIVLTNTSDIVMDFVLSIPQDGAFVKKEFELEPDRGSLQPGESQEVLMELVSTAVKSYDYYLTVDIPGVGKGCCGAHPRGCQVPDVQVKVKEISYDECFVRYPYEMDLVLVNSSNELQAKYEIVPRRTPRRRRVRGGARDRTIPAGEEGVVKVRLTCVKLSRFRLPLFVNIAGSVLPPLQATLTTSSAAPSW